MGNARLKAARHNDQAEDLKMDMSPMIDMVFLLLIFFMIASTMITIKLDPEVRPPLAPDSEVDPKYTGRIVVNIMEDGTMWGIDGRRGKEFDEIAITELAAKVLERYEGTSTKVRLFIRADKAAPVLAIKKATKAAGAAGVNNVMFTAYKFE